MKEKITGDDNGLVGFRKKIIEQTDHKSHKKETFVPLLLVSMLVST